MMEKRQFDSEMLTKPPAKGFAVETVLSHFAIITYMVDPEKLRPHVHERFELNCITLHDGSQKALVSVVPFLDNDFYFVRCPWPKWTFGQTNYRAYVTDTKTEEQVVWFFGTSLSSFVVNIPRFAWKLPWHNANIDFETEYSKELGRYTKYRMNTRSHWAPAELELEDLGLPPKNLHGFPDLESALVVLTHPLQGYYYRSDKRLGRYSIWHDKLQLTEGRVITASFPLLEDLGLVHNGDLDSIHSVLIQPETAFTIYLPPSIE